MIQVPVNENNDLKFRPNISMIPGGKTLAYSNNVNLNVSYQRDGSGNLVLDEKGDPIPLIKSSMELFTEGGNS